MSINLSQEEINKIRKESPMRKHRHTWKPFNYPWAYEYKILQERMHWLPDEVCLDKDCVEFHQLEQYEKEVLTRVLRFFTQTDVEVAASYINYYIPYFNNNPEITVMLTCFANMEGTHIIAYNNLLTQLQLDDIDISYIEKYQSMLDKHNFMKLFDVNNPENVAITMALVSGFVEGCVLFSSFAIINYFSLRRGDFTNPNNSINKTNCLKGVGQIVSLSIRDENLHTKAMIHLFHEFVKDMHIDISLIKDKIYYYVKQLISIEKDFINFCLPTGDLDGLSRKDLYDYVEFLADTRLIQLGLQPIYGYNKNSLNPLPWTEQFLQLSENANFFETRPTSYCKFNKSNSNITEETWDA